MEVCKKCSGPLPEGANFCPACGRSVSPAKRRHRKRAQGSGSIWKMEGVRRRPWRAVKNGITIGTFATYAEADEALQKVKEQGVNERYNITFAEVYDLWYPEKARTVSKSQAGCYRGAYSHCEPLYGLKFRGIHRSDYQAIIMQMEEDGLARSTCEKVLQLFGQMDDWGVAEGIIAKSRASGVSTVAQQKGERVPFSDEDLRALMQSNHRAAKIAIILCATGCRPGELFAARLDDCHNGYFIGGSKTEAGKRRVIAVARFGAAAYQELLAAARAAGGETLGAGYDGNTVVNNFTRRDFKELMGEIGRPGFTPYNCRHTMATLMVKAGMSKKAIQMQMGHASTMMQDRYEHPEVEYLTGQVSRVAI